MFKVENWQYNAYTNATDYVAREDQLPVNLMVVIGDDSRNYPGTLEWTLHLIKLKIKHQLIVVPDLPHSGMGQGNGWQVENTGERIYRFVAKGLTEIPKKTERPAATRDGRNSRPTPTAPTAFDPATSCPGTSPVNTKDKEEALRLRLPW